MGEVGLNGAFTATDRGQPMQVYRQRGPFFPLDPRVEELSLPAIAHALSLQCRFGGHVREFYSVAQHSVLVSSLCREYPMEGLLHDATEAYLGDIIKPLKVLFPLYSEAEERMEKVIAERWRLTWPWPQEVRNADAVLLATEKRDLLIPNDQDWGPMPEPMPEEIVPWAPPYAEEQFMLRFLELQEGGG